MKTHVCSQDRVDHKLTHGDVSESLGPVSAKDLRIGCAVERFQDRTIVVELSKRCIQSDQESVVHTRVAHIMANGRDEEGQCIKRLQ